MIKGPHTFGKCFAYKPKFIQGVHIPVCVYSLEIWNSDCLQLENDKEKVQLLGVNQLLKF